MNVVLSLWLTVPSLGIWITPGDPLVKTTRCPARLLSSLLTWKLSLPQTQGSCHMKETPKGGLLWVFCFFWSIPRAHTQREAREMVGKKEMAKAAEAERRRYIQNIYTHVHHHRLLSDRGGWGPGFGHQHFSYPQVSWKSLDPILRLRELGSQHPVLWLQASFRHLRTCSSQIFNFPFQPFFFYRWGPKQTSQRYHIILASFASLLITTGK